MDAVVLGLVVAGWQKSARGELIRGLVAEPKRLLVASPCILLVCHPWVARVNAACSVGRPILPYRLWVLVDIMMAESGESP